VIVTMKRRVPVGKPGHVVFGRSALPTGRLALSILLARKSFTSGRPLFTEMPSTSAWRSAKTSAVRPFGQRPSGQTRDQNLRSPHENTSEHGASLSFGPRPVARQPFGPKPRISGWVA
jgi:hypothetical protein